MGRKSTRTWNTVYLSVDLPAGLLGSLYVTAAQRRMDVSQIIERLIEEWLVAQENTAGGWGEAVAGEPGSQAAD